MPRPPQSRFFGVLFQTDVWYMADALISIG